MPYIPQYTRGHTIPNTDHPGELTYELYLLCLSALPPDPHYADFAVVLGCLEATKLELYRQRIAPYEDAKKEENGDVLCPSDR